RLDAHLGADPVAGLGDAVGAGVGRDVTLRVDHRHLAKRGHRIGGDETTEEGRGGAATAHAFEAARAVAHLDDGLGRYGADAGFRPGHAAAGPEVVRFDGDAHRPGDRIPRDDRVGHEEDLSYKYREITAILQVRKDGEEVGVE